MTAPRPGKRGWPGNETANRHQVILNILLSQESFFPDSYQALRRALEQDAECYVSAAAATDIYYIFRKSLQPQELAKAHLHSLSQLVQITDVQPTDISNDLLADMPDFEVAIVDAIAARVGAEQILTKNTKDFAGQPCPPSGRRGSNLQHERNLG